MLYKSTIECPNGHRTVLLHADRDELEALLDAPDLIECEECGEHGYYEATEVEPA